MGGHEGLEGGGCPALIKFDNRLAGNFLIAPAVALNGYPLVILVPDHGPVAHLKSLGRLGQSVFLVQAGFLNLFDGEHGVRRVYEFGYFVKSDDSRFAIKWRLC